MFEHSAIRKGTVPGQPAAATRVHDDENAKSHGADWRRDPAKSEVLTLHTHVGNCTPSTNEKLKRSVVSPPHLVTLPFVYTCRYPRTHSDFVPTNRESFCSYTLWSFGAFSSNNNLTICTGVIFLLQNYSCQKLHCIINAYVFSPFVLRCVLNLFTLPTCNATRRTVLHAWPRMADLLFYHVQFTPLLSCTHVYLL